jgi:hypothetical protein
MSEPKYSQDIIRRYREMNEANAFNREVTERVPVDLDCDDVSFACGHKQRINRLFFKIPGTSQNQNSFHCNECEKEWLARAVEEEEKGKG